jgi:Xaa-Pro aminopeptidase
LQGKAWRAGDREEVEMLDALERDRRYGLIRERMISEDLDALVVMSSAQINEKGFVRYLTNYRHILYNLVVIFPRSGEARLLVPSPVQKYWAGRLSWIRNVEEQVPSLSEAISRNVRDMELHRGRLGLINTKIMPAYTYLALVKEFPEATMIDGTSIIEEARMVKSGPEQALVRKTAALADLSFKVLADVVRPGITEREIIARIDSELISGGAEDIFHLVTSRQGNLFPYAPSDRKIEKGDIVILNTELSGPSGYWIQMVRTSFVGRPKPEFEGMYDTLVGIASDLTKELRPGKKVSGVADWVRTQIISSGYEIGVNFGHSLGLDVVERPQVHVSEEMTLKPGMVITVHPQLVSKGKEATVWFADTYLITEGVAEALTTIDPVGLKVVG